jgi:uncharacterized protein (DUF983 family)
MNGNSCPKCNNPVMPYSRFIREAEPFKQSACGSCGVILKRSPKVYGYLSIMLLILVGVSVPLFLGMAETRMAHWTMWGIAVIWLASWAVLVNFLSWRYIGWVVAEQDSE